MLTKRNTKSALMDKPKLQAGGLKAADFIVTIIFLAIAAFAVYLFRQDLMRTIDMRDTEPIGHIVIRRNTVQRRLADRVLWDRLAMDSPVYPGDLIRVAELSSATLYAEGSSIDINENTLIRITKAADGESLQIILSEGTLSLVTTEDSARITLDINGRQVQTVSATVINVTSARDGMAVQIREGTAQFIDEGHAREIQVGGLIALDASGIELAQRAAVVTRPVSNARYINSNRAPFPVSFSWNRINLEANEQLTLEIASDRNFNNTAYINENLDRQAEASLEIGQWYWRLSYENKTLEEGRFTIADGSGPALQSPAENSVIRHSGGLPVLNFQWAAVSQAVSYVLEVSAAPDFLNPQIRRQSQITAFTDSSLGEGTWYWSVMPVFPAVFTGSPSFSRTSNFSIERTIIETQTEQPSLTEWFTAKAVEVRPELTPAVLPEPEIKPEPEVLLPAPVVQRAAAPIPLLPAPRNLQPPNRRRFTMSDLQTQRTMSFNWQAVQGANAYIFTILPANTRRKATGLPFAGS